MNDDVKALKKSFLHNPMALNLEDGQLPLDTQLAQFQISCEEDDKFAEANKTASAYLNFHFKTDSLLSLTQPLESMQEDILRFLTWYQSLPGEERTTISKAGILNEIKTEFVFQMGRMEGEGVETLDETKDVIRRTDNDANVDLSAPQRITLNMSRALDMKQQAVEKARKEPDGFFLVEESQLNDWHRALWEDVSDSCQGLAGKIRTKDVYSYSHRYPAPDTIKCGFERFIDAFCEIAKSVRSNTAVHMMERLRETIKWAEWSLVYFLALHPYNDGNGRVGRLLAAYVLSSIFPFEVSMYMTREQYLQALILTQNCPCDCATTDEEEVLCSTYDEMFKNVQPGLLSTMILDACWYNCCEFQQKVKDKAPYILEKFPLV